MAIIVQDSFTDVNETLLSNHTPTPVGGFSWLSSNAKIYENGLKYANVTGEGFASCRPSIPPPPGSVGVYIQIQIKSLNINQSFRLYTRNSGSNNLYLKIEPWTNVGYLQAGAEYLAFSYTPVVNDIIRFETIDNIMSFYLNGSLHTQFSSLSIISEGWFVFYISGRFDTSSIFGNFEAGTLINIPSAPTNLILACGV